MGDAPGHEPARLITVCNAGTGQTGCGWGR